MNWSTQDLTQLPSTDIKIKYSYFLAIRSKALHIKYPFVEKHKSFYGVKQIIYTFFLFKNFNFSKNLRKY